VDKQRKQPTKLANSEKAVEVGAVWSESDETVEKFNSGRFVLELPTKGMALAMAAPGLQ